MTTKHFNKIDFALVKVFRNQEVKQLDKLEDYHSYFEFNPLTDLDVQFVTYFKSFISHPEMQRVYNDYTAYSTVELADYLGHRNVHEFPIPISLIKMPEAKYYVIIYYMLKNMKYEKIKRVWTEEQLSVITTRSRFTIIHAGAGTGKTTTMNERLFRLVKSEEGVILVSYTNSAINENHERLFEYPGLGGKIGKKQYKKEVAISTIDSIAGYINAAYIHKKAFTNKEEVDYEGEIRTAISLVRNNPVDVKKKFSQYKHVILDEAQDICLLRAALIFAMTYAGIFETCTIAGDPRQRLNDRAGDWFSNLWVNSKDPFGDIVEVNKVGFSTSYRFKTQLLLDVCNSLSQTRPIIHHELKFPINFKPQYSRELEWFLCKYSCADHIIEKLADRIIDLHQTDKIPYSDMLVAGPCLNTNNRTSEFAARVACVFKEKGIPCYIEATGAFKPSGIRFSTIHGCKGQEFEVVILFGFGDFTNTFTMIPRESADSSIFVAHTRAKSRIIHILHVPKAPRGLEGRFFSGNFLQLQKEYDEYMSKKGDKEFISVVNISNTTTNSNDVNKKQEEKEEEEIEEKQQYIPSHPVSKLSADFGFVELMKTNNFSIQKQLLNPIPISVVPECPQNANPRWWGIACGIGIQMHCTFSYPQVFIDYINENYKIVPDVVYKKMLKDHLICKGRHIRDGQCVIAQSAINCIKLHEHNKCKEIFKKSPLKIEWNEFIMVVMICDFFYSSHMLSRYDVIDPVCPEGIFSIYSTIARNFLTVYGTLAKAEVPVAFIEPYSEIHGSIDCRYENDASIVLLEVKTVDRDFNESDYLQTALYNILYSLENEGKPVYSILYNCRQNTYMKVDTNKNLEQWKYMLKAYLQLFCHIEFTERLITKKYEKTMKANSTCSNSSNSTNSTNSMSTSSNSTNSTNSATDLDQELSMHNTWCVDTEFANGSQIFDIAIVNLKHPYRSIISTVNVAFNGLKFASEWLTLPKELFQSSPKINDISFKFNELCALYVQEPKIYAYKSGVDFSWIENSNVEKIDLAPIVKEKSKLLGSFSANCACPKLGDYFGSVFMPLQFLPHLTAHTALSDSLMLYTMLKLRVV